MDLKGEALVFQSPFHPNFLEQKKSYFFRGVSMETEIQADANVDFGLPMRVQQDSHAS